MALRIRKGGRIFCAALTEAQDGDTYIDDNLSYQMTVVNKVLVTYPMQKHAETGEWFWAGWEQGIHQPTAVSKRKIAVVLGCDTSEI